MPRSFWFDASAYILGDNKADKSASNSLNPSIFEGLVTLCAPDAVCFSRHIPHASGRILAERSLSISHCFLTFPQHGHFIYCPSGFQESLSSLFSISFRSTVYATFTSLSFLTINSESPYSEPLSAQSYVYPSLVHGYFPSK